MLLYIVRISMLGLTIALCCLQQDKHFEPLAIPAWREYKQALNALPEFEVILYQSDIPSNSEKVSRLIFKRPSSAMAETTLLKTFWDGNELTIYKRGEPRPLRLKTEPSFGAFDLLDVAPPIGFHSTARISSLEAQDVKSGESRFGMLVESAWVDRFGYVEYWFDAKTKLISQLNWGQWGSGASNRSSARLVWNLNPKFPANAFIPSPLEPLPIPSSRYFKFRPMSRFTSNAGTVVVQLPGGLRDRIEVAKSSELEFAATTNRAEMKLAVGAYIFRLPTYSFLMTVHEGFESVAYLGAVINQKGRNINLRNAANRTTIEVPSNQKPTLVFPGTFEYLDGKKAKKVKVAPGQIVKI